MSETPDTALAAAPGDVGEYCRRVEDYLTRANAGHLVRIVGPGFDLVRQWATAGVPLSVVCRGIDLKTERHAAGASKRPLRIEFCADDVRSVFDHWRRAVGLSGMAFGDAVEGPGVNDAEPGAESEAEPTKTKRPSLGRHLDRAIDRLSRAMARTDVPEGLRDACELVLQSLVDLRGSSKKARGEARDQIAATLIELDRELATAARTHAPVDWMGALRAEAEADLAPFRGRLARADWTRSTEATIDRLLRDRFGLPFLDL